MEQIITVSHLQKSFKNNKVLKDLSFFVKKGSIFALLGSNGAGKTTAVRILSTLSMADGGTATVCGFDVAQEPAQVRGCISLTGQYAAVDEALTGRENLNLIASLKRLPKSNTQINELLSIFQLEEAANRITSTYSGGMRRKLDIAMSLLGNPQVIFLDEPTTGLDPQNRIAMWEMVKELALGGTTVFLTTQYLEEAEHLANHIAILHEGRITAEGTPNDLKMVLPRGGIQLNYESTEDAKKALELLKGYKAVIVKRAIDVATDGSPAQFINVLSLLEGTPLVSFTHKLPTLEDVFLTLIGEKKPVETPTHGGEK